MKSWHWILVPIAVLVLVVGWRTIETGNVKKALNWRPVVFGPHEFEDCGQDSFVVKMPLKDVRRRLMKANLTHKIIQEQSGTILYDKDAGRNFNGPIKDWQLFFNRNVGIKIDNPHYGEMQLDFIQAVHVDKTFIKSEFTLTKPVDSLQHYRCCITMTSIPEGTRVDYKVCIKVTEHAPESYYQYIQEQLQYAVVQSTNNFKKGFLEVCQ